MKLKKVLKKISMQTIEIQTDLHLSVEISIRYSYSNIAWNSKSEERTSRLKGSAKFQVNIK
jgi:hypothetical protein